MCPNRLRDATKRMSSMKGSKGPASTDEATAYDSVTKGERNPAGVCENYAYRIPVLGNTRCATALDGLQTYLLKDKT